MGHEATLGTGVRALVTGGGGFLGRAIVERLLARGVTVRSFARGHYPDLERLGVEALRGDLRDADAVRKACEGQDVVFHTAARAGVWGSYREFHEVNTTGTQNVIDACRSVGTPRLVYTSTPSVVFDGRDMEGVDESAPYPRRYDSAYPATKAEAEKRIRRANGPALATVSLRPHLVWGPGDPHFLPRILARARSGRLRIVGRNENKVDTIYIDNAAEAHLLAADRLSADSPVAGRVYFITQGEPVHLWDMVNWILEAAGENPPIRSIPSSAAFMLGAALEVTFRLLRMQGEPPMTRFLARELATSHWFDITAARQDLDYEPLVSTSEGLARLQRWCSNAHV